MTSGRTPENSTRLGYIKQQESVNFVILVFEEIIERKAH